MSLINEAVYNYVNTELTKLALQGKTSAIFCLSEAYGRLSMLTDLSPVISQDELEKIAKICTSKNESGNYFAALCSLEFGNKDTMN